MFLKADRFKTSIPTTKPNLHHRPCQSRSTTAACAQLKVHPGAAAAPASVQVMNLHISVPHWKGCADEGDPDNVAIYCLHLQSGPCLPTALRRAGHRHTRVFLFGARRCQIKISHHLANTERQKFSVPTSMQQVLHIYKQHPSDSPGR